VISETHRLNQNVLGNTTDESDRPELVRLSRPFRLNFK
jgi:hypothetical protein